MELKTQKLKEQLPPGAQKEIADNTGYSFQFVSLVLNGDRFNDVIIEAAISYLSAYKKKKTALNKKIEAV